MQHTPQQLKEKLLEGLDEENNVVDMPCVCEAISLLEKYPITRDILEETRIGRYVNELRRKTGDEQLARRAKKLVRSWQKLISGSASNASVNGEGVTKVTAPGRTHDGGDDSLGPAGLNSSSVMSKTSSPVCVSWPAKTDCVISSLSPRKPAGKTNTTSLPQSVKRSYSSPQLLPDSCKRLCVSPSISSISPSLSSQPTTPDSTASVSGNMPPGHRPVNNVSSKPNVPSRSHKEGSGEVKLKAPSPNETWSPVSNNRHSHVDGAPSVKLKSDQNGVINQTATLSNAKDAGTYSHSIESIGLKTTIRIKRVPPNGVVPPVETPKKRGRGRPPKIRPPDDSPQEGTTPTTAKNIYEKRSLNLSMKTDMETPLRDKFLSFTPKVKTMAELVQDLQSKNSLSVGKETVRKISEIQREADDSYSSIVPAGAKPRPRKKPGTRTELITPSTPVSLKTKTEMVHKFLETSLNQSPPEDICPLKYEMLRSESPGPASIGFDDSVDIHDQGSSPVDAKCDQITNQSVINEKNKSANITGSPDIKLSEPSEQETIKPLSLEEIYSKYPPLDLGIFQFDDGEYEMPDPVDVNNGIVDRLHGDHWSGVNGLHDFAGSWVDWTQTLALESYKTDLLNVLPYVIVDD